MNIKLVIALLAAIGISVAAFFSANEGPQPSPEAVAPSATSTVPAATTTPAAATTSTVSVSAGVTVVTPKPVSPVAPVTKPADPEPTPAGYTLAEVAMHSGEANCWTAINGSVYDISAFFGEHPGGDRNLLRICGKDGSAAFNGQHGGDAKPERILASFMIGPLRD